MSREQRILLIDDHQTVFKLLEAIVRIKGYTLLYADSGQQGIVKAREEQPDMILLDVMMPDLDGFKVCQFLKEHEDTKDIPVMFLTARGGEDDMTNGCKAGAVGFMTKPFQTTDVLKQIERIMTGRD